LSNEVYLEDRKGKNVCKKETEFGSEGKIGQKRGGGVLRYEEKIGTAVSIQKKMGILPPLF
jgi:hypothetical protein